MSFILCLTCVHGYIKCLQLINEWYKLASLHDTHTKRAWNALVTDSVAAALSVQ